MKLEFAEELYNMAVNANSLGKSSSLISQVKQTQTNPTEYKLFGNYPNPFNPTTTIIYTLPFESEVTVTVYDLRGSVVRTFMLGNQSAGYKNLLWDGRNDYGEAVSSGVYFYTLKAVSLERNGKTFAKSAKYILLN